MDEIQKKKYQKNLKKLDAFVEDLQREFNANLPVSAEIGREEMILAEKD